MTSKEHKQSDFMAKVTMGLKLSYDRMVQSKIEKNQSMVIMHNGKVITIKASEIKNL